MYISHFRSQKLMYKFPRVVALRQYCCLTGRVRRMLCTSIFVLVVCGTCSHCLYTTSSQVYGVAVYCEYEFKFSISRLCFLVACDARFNMRFLVLAQFCVSVKRVYENVVEFNIMLVCGSHIGSLILRYYLCSTINGCKVKCLLG